MGLSFIAIFVIRQSAILASSSFLGRQSAILDLSSDLLSDSSSSCLFALSVIFTSTPIHWTIHPRLSSLSSDIPILLRPRFFPLPSLFASLRSHRTLWQFLGFRSHHSMVTSTHPLSTTSMLASARHRQVICEKVKDSDIAVLDKKKYLVPKVCFLALPFQGVSAFVGMAHWWCWAVRIGRSGDGDGFRLTTMVDVHVRRWLGVAFNQRMIGIGESREIDGLVAEWKPRVLCRNHWIKDHCGSGMNADSCSSPFSYNRHSSLPRRLLHTSTTSRTPLDP
jgi:hypothetical protein